jgi:hypothetical protein
MKWIFVYLIILIVAVIGILVSISLTKAGCDILAIIAGIIFAIIVIGLSGWVAALIMTEEYNKWSNRE